MEAERLVGARGESQAGHGNLTLAGRMKGASQAVHGAPRPSVILMAQLGKVCSGFAVGAEAYGLH